MNIESRQKQFDFDGPEAIKPEVLETFPYESQGDPLDVDIDTDEFTAVCPWTGLPDFGEVIVSYVPDEVILELRSYKYYLLSYTGRSAWCRNTSRAASWTISSRRCGRFA